MWLFLFKEKRESSRRRHGKKRSSSGQASKRRDSESDYSKSDSSTSEESEDSEPGTTSQSIVAEITPPFKKQVPGENPPLDMPVINPTLQTTIIEAPPSVINSDIPSLRSDGISTPVKKKKKSSKKNEVIKKDFDLSDVTKSYYTPHQYKVVSGKYMVSSNMYIQVRLHPPGETGLGWDYPAVTIAKRTKENKAYEQTFPLSQIDRIISILQEIRATNDDFFVNQINRTQ